MKYFKLAYYLLFICIVATSCAADDSIIPDAAKKGVQVQLTIQFPETATRQTTTHPGTAYERNIDNLRLYVFEKNGTSSYTLKEEVKGITMSAAAENGDRIVMGELFKNYSNPVKIVVLTNLNNKGLTFGNLPGEGSTLAKFYDELIYIRTGDATSSWPLDQLPMWGESVEITTPQKGHNTIASLSLTRAIARVDVLVNEGNGFSDKEFFKITRIEVCRYNDRGYCTPGTTANQPNVPEGAKIVETPLAYTDFYNTPYACENRIYIPEQTNIGATDNQKVFLILTAVIDATGKTKEFTINFQTNGTGTAFNVLRNNVYVFNIQSVKIEKEKPVEITLSYKVADWEKINIEVPPYEGVTK